MKMRRVDRLQHTITMKRREETVSVGKQCNAGRADPRPRCTVSCVCYSGCALPKAISCAVLCCAVPAINSSFADLKNPRLTLLHLFNDLQI